MRKIEEIIQRIIKEYEELYINKLENQEEMDNLTRPIFIKETESIITFQHRKYQAPYKN